MVGIVARRAAAAGRGKKSCVKIAQITAALPSLEHPLPQSTASSSCSSALPSLEPQSTASIASQQEQPVYVSSSLEVGASYEVECGPGKCAEPTIMLGKCCVVLLHVSMVMMLVSCFCCHISVLIDGICNSIQPELHHFSAGQRSLLHCFGVCLTGLVLCS